MMQQVYLPKINTPASPAMCLQYVDDAGNAPERSRTAKAAYEKERAAGRIRLSELPEGVWVVVWFEFTRGSYRYADGSVVYYKDAWHIAFAKRTGNRVEIHDSEVHSGARQPYTALAAVEAWWAAYGTRYVGWSTHCDGREYVKEVNMDKITRDHENVLAFLATGGYPGTGYDYRFTGQPLTQATLDQLLNHWREQQVAPGGKDAQLRAQSDMIVALLSSNKEPISDTELKLKQINAKAQEIVELSK